MRAKDLPDKFNLFTAKRECCYTSACRRGWGTLNKPLKTAIIDNPRLLEEVGV